ncbi:glycosyltransferase family 8 protein, partial [Campylobacter sp. BCW_4322]
MENKTNIPIVFSVDSNYIGALRVAIGSLVSNLNSSKYCIIYILHTELKSKTIIKFLNSCRFHNAKIIFLNIKSLVEKFTNKYKVKLYGTGHFTISMYYRFLIPFIFKKYKKVIYLDCDIIVKNDINDLYNVNIQDNYIGAIRDIVVENIKLKINCEYSVFINKILKIEDEKYFNSGVLIFNIDKCNQNKFVDNCFKSLSLLENNLYCPDQDVLNYVCKNKVYYISFKWNFMWNIESVVEKYKEVYLDKRIICDFESSKKNPYIIHYCDYFKPWSHPYLPYADCWWKYARETPFYEEILFDNISKFNQNHYKPYGAVDRIKN